MDLPESLVHAISDLARKYDLKRVVLFGSRARGDSSSRSDIDLAVYTDSPFQRKGYLASDIDDLPTLLKIDLVFVDDTMELRLKDRITQEGVVIYERSCDEVG